MPTVPIPSPPAPNQLALWEESERALPHLLIWASLFGMVERGKRKNLEDTLLFDNGEHKIKYSGPMLDQADADLYMAITTLCNMQNTAHIYVPIRSLLKMSGRSSGGKDREWANRSIQRLLSATVSVEGKPYLRMGHLISDVGIDYSLGENKPRYYIFVNQSMMDLFAQGGTRFITTERQMLKGELTKLLQMFVKLQPATPSKPIRYEVSELHEILRSQSQLKGFRTKLKASFEQLVLHNIVERYSIIDGTVEYVLEPGVYKRSLVDKEAAAQRNLIEKNKMRHLGKTP